MPDDNLGSATVTRDNMGKFTYTVVRGTGDLLRGENPTDLKSRGDWPGTQLVRTDTAADATNRAGMTYANVYSDIQAPTQAYEADGTTTAFTVGTSVIVAGDVATDGSNFAATLNVNPGDNQAPIMGQFRCITAPCSISVDADGEIVANTGYTFHVETGIARQDSDYLAWGVWLTVPGAVIATGEFQGTTTTGVFASGNDVFAVNAALKGKATYNGVATGLYSAGGMVENFDADVMLEANFGGIVGADSVTTDATANDGLLLGVVTGMVSNINAGGMAVDGSLSLLRAPVLTEQPGTLATPSTSGFIGSTDGILGGVTYRGDWGGQFYGPNAMAGSGDAIMQDYIPHDRRGNLRRCGREWGEPPWRVRLVEAE